MPSHIRSIACALALAVAVAPIVFAHPQSTSASKDKGTVYDAAFTFGDTTYRGTMTLTFDKNVVSGAMKIDSPVPVTGTVAGKRDGTKLTFAYPFSMGGDQPCDGRVTIDATMDQKADTASGTARSVGCGDQPVDGTFSLKRHEDK